MSDPDGIRRLLDDDEAFEPTDDEDVYAVVTTAFDARVTVATGSGGSELVVEVRAPTLSAAVDGDAVASVVEDGWFETFERRLADAGMALAGDLAAGPAADRDGAELVVEATLPAGDPGRAVADARAFVEYVEGTYMEGVIPGYDYRDPVAGMRHRAYTER